MHSNDDDIYFLSYGNSIKQIGTELEEADFVNYKRSITILNLKKRFLLKNFDISF